MDYKYTYKLYTKYSLYVSNYRNISMDWNLEVMYVR